jgi:hypothetical protein
MPLPRPLPWKPHNLVLDIREVLADPLINRRIFAPERSWDVGVALAKLSLQLDRIVQKRAHRAPENSGKDSRG